MRNELRKRTELVDKALDRYVPELDNPQGEIYKAMRYSLFAGGKRLRPILMLETAKMCGGSWEDVEPFACAMEMIHTYSLIHDDLPAMDNDDLRRGMPTSHIKFGEDMAILAGDALLNKAFEIVSSHNYDNPCKAMRAISVLSASSGTEGMIGGQVVDLKSEGVKIPLERLRYIHLLKTGALIRSSCIIGAVMAGAGDEDIAAIDDFAVNLGIAFQIQDDILDVIGSEEDLGKPIGSDDECGKNTYVTVCGLEKSLESVKEFSEKAKQALAPFGNRAGFLIRLTEYLTDRRS